MTTDIEEAAERASEREHSEIRVFGPPGTGKTTHCARQIGRAAAKYGADAVMVTSFSKAAALELVSRDLPIQPDHVGTLHAHCYRALGRPVIAESKASQWNEEHPDWAITGVRDNDLDDPYDRPTGGGRVKTGDDLLGEANRWRNRLADFRDWPDVAARMFYQEWLSWRRDHDLLDFTDLLEVARRDVKIAPGDPRVIFLDEAQDSTPLHLAIIRQWGRRADYLVVVGDDDQCIQSHIGATPETFLSPPLPADQKIVLSQSHRVPEAIHEAAMRWIKYVARREPKEYRPRPERGEAVEFDGGYYAMTSWRRPSMIIDGAEREVESGRTVMLLASCSYMLGPLRSELMARGLAFHNPYRVSRGDWNPLSITRGTSAAERVLAFIKPHPEGGGQPWTPEDWKKWAAWLVAAGTFRRGGKTGPKDMPPEETIALAQLKEWLEPKAYNALIDGVMYEALDGHIEWWLKRVEEDRARVAAYPARIIRERGVEALREKPKIIIGTIHSVKGGEADSVFLFPDMSGAAKNEWDLGRAGRDSIIRLFYVGMTRARHKLVVCPAYDYAVTGLV